MVVVLKVRRRKVESGIAANVVPVAKSAEAACGKGDGTSATSVAMPVEVSSIVVCVVFVYVVVRIECLARRVVCWLEVQ